MVSVVQMMKKDGLRNPFLPLSTASLLTTSLSSHSYMMVLWPITRQSKMTKVMAPMGMTEAEMASVTRRNDICQPPRASVVAQ